MPNPRQLINQVEKLISERPASACRHYHLCWLEGKLQCLPTNHTDKPHPVFEVLYEADLGDGLTAERWTKLGDKLAMFFQHTK